MSYRVIITETAKQDLREIAFWIAEKSKDRKIAERFVAELRDELKTLNSFPNAGSIPRDRILMSAGYRFIAHKDYLIFYTVDDACKTVTVQAVFNGRMDYMRVMRKYI